MTGDSDLAVLRRALSGRTAALPALVDRWTSIIQARVVRVLRRRGDIDQRTQQEIEGFVQQVFVSLFENKGESLRAWQPERGLSLDNWVGLLAERQVLSLLRTRKRNPWTEQPVLVEELDRTSPAPDPETRALSRDALDRLLDRLQERLSPLGWRLFRLLYLEEKSVDDAAAGCDMSHAAIYAWRSRLRRLARELRDELSETAASMHRPIREPDRR